MLEWIAKQNDVVVSIGYVLLMGLMIIGSAFLGRRIYMRNDKQKGKGNH